jgi:glycosyltransferase involved in cell wall biosynthesis
LIETGFISQSVLQDYMLACDALVTALADTTASRARWPSKVNPFLALGRATVITRVGDLPDLLAREGAAVVTAAASADIASGVCALFDDPNLRDDIERRARAVATGVLAWPALAAELEGFYVTLRAETQGL